MQNKEREILETAARLFQAKGFAATSIRDIAQAAGVQKAAIYHYVSNKEELLRRIFAETANELNTFMQELLASPMSNLQRLRRAISIYLTFVVGRGAAITVAFRDARGMSAEHVQWLENISQNHMQLWNQIIRSGIATGEFRPVEVPMASFAILGACSWMHAWYSPGGRLTAEEIAECFADLFVSGLAANPQTTTLAGAGASGSHPPYLAELPVRFAEADPTGQLPLPVLVQYCQAAVEDLFSACEWPYERLRRERRVVMRVRQFQCEVQGGAQAGDRLRIHVDAGGLHEECLHLRLRVQRLTDGATIALVHLVQEVTEAATGTSVAWPLDIGGMVLGRLAVCGAKLSGADPDT